MRSLLLIVSLLFCCCFNRQQQVVARDEGSLTEVSDSLFVYTEDDMYRYTELGWACKQGELERVKTLIGQGASLECAEDDCYQLDAIYIAVKSGNVKLVKYLLENRLYDGIDRPYTEYGWSLLGLTTLIEDTATSVEIAELLVKAGANLQGCGYLGFDYVIYPLLFAVKNNKIPLAKYLIDSGADINVVDIQGDSISTLIKYDSVSNEMKNYITSVLEAE